MGNLGRPGPFGPGVSTFKPPTVEPDAPPADYEVPPSLVRRKVARPGPYRPGITIFKPRPLAVIPDRVQGAGLQFDAATPFGTDSTGTVWNFSHTVAGFPKPVLYLAFTFNNDPGAIVAVTYNGVAMTSIASRTLVEWAFVYRLVAPASGPNTVSVQWTNVRNGAAVAWSYYTADQSTPESNLTTETDGDESITVTTTSIGIAAFALSTASGVDLTPPSGLTERAKAVGSFGASRVFVGDAPGTGSGVTAGWPSTGTVSFFTGFNVNGVPIIRPRTATKAMISGKGRF